MRSRADGARDGLAACLDRLAAPARAIAGIELERPADVLVDGGPVALGAAGQIDAFGPHDPSARQPVAIGWCSWIRFPTVSESTATLTGRLPGMSQLPVEAQYGQFDEQMQSP